MPTDALQSPVFRDHSWQMTWGERFALEGLLSQLRPGVAIETGTAQGGSVRRIAAHSDQVHSFDIEPAVAELASQLPNVVFHIGDSAALLPATLAELTAQNRHVDFALIDGDHSSEGVQRDARALLDSEACRETVIVFHDAANDAVRRGLEALELFDHPKVKACFLDFIPGYLCLANHPEYPHAIWNGLGLVVLGERDGEIVRNRDYIDVPDLYRRARDLPRGESASEASIPTSVSEQVPALPRARRYTALAAAAFFGAAAGAAAARLPPSRR